MCYVSSFFVKRTRNPGCLGVRLSCFGVRVLCMDGTVMYLQLQQHGKSCVQAGEQRLRKRSKMCRRGDVQYSTVQDVMVQSKKW